MILTLSPVPRVPGALVHVYLEDTTYADAPARVLLHATRPADPQGDTLTIELDRPLIAPNTVCTIRVHADLDGDNLISVGDYITTESYSFGENVVIQLHRVEPATPLPQAPPSLSI